MDKRYDYHLHEQTYQQYWAAHNTYSTHNNPGTLYSIDTPPPTVSGSLHIGHIFSYTQTDIIARYKRMSGYSVFYPFGFDDNGLPTERYVEKKRTIRAHQLPRSEFITMCLEESAIAADNFKQLWQRMGISADWSKTYSTISCESRKIAQTSFIELFKKGHIYRKNEPALYCTTCFTSVAQAELDDKEVASYFNDIIFKDEYGNDLVIGTTRPELLPSCVALLFNPTDERYKYLEGQQATVPLFNFTVPIMADDMVDKNKGTGLVMCCTFGDKKDIEWFKKHTLSYKPSLDFTGKWLSNTGILAGLKVHEARARIIQELREHHLLVHQKPITHAVNVHERCKKEIEYLLLAQWFVSILPLKQELLEKTNQINWHPSFMKSRLVNWIENIGWDWCISRQRFYGIPFPAWHCQNCNTTLLADINQLPIDPQESTYTGTCTVCQSSRIVPDTDVMDTWNTSSLTPYICAQLYNNESKLSLETTPFIPMSMRPQAHDIIRTWAFDTIIKTYLHQDRIPWHDIVISGHVLSDSKEKLSKSKENASLAPENLLTRYPADAIRYWTASGNLGHDIAFSENQLKIGLRLITKLWNAFLFIKEHIQENHTSSPALSTPIIIKSESTPEHLGTLNYWLLHKLTETYTSYQNYLDQYEFGLALNQIEQFFWQIFCDNYIEMIKHQLFNPDLYSPQEVTATRWTLYHVGLRILQLYAPYVPHVTEALYQELYKQHSMADSLHQTRFITYQIPITNDTRVYIAEQLLNVAAQIRKLKTEHQLSLKTPLLSLEIYSTDELFSEQVSHHEHLIRGITHALDIYTVRGHTSHEGLVQDNGQWRATINIPNK